MDRASSSGRAAMWKRLAKGREAALSGPPHFGHFRYEMDEEGVVRHAKRKEWARGDEKIGFLHEIFKDGEPYITHLEFLLNHVREVKSIPQFVLLELGYEKCPPCGALQETLKANKALRAHCEGDDAPGFVLSCTGTRKWSNEVDVTLNTSKFSEDDMKVLCHNLGIEGKCDADAIAQRVWDPSGGIMLAAEKVTSSDGGAGKETTEFKLHIANAKVDFRFPALVLWTKYSPEPLTWQLTEKVSDISAPALQAIEDIMFWEGEYPRFLERAVFFVQFATSCVIGNKNTPYGTITGKNYLRVGKAFGETAGFGWVGVRAPGLEELKCEAFGALMSTYTKILYNVKNGSLNRIWDNGKIAEGLNERVRQVLDDYMHRVNHVNGEVAATGEES